MALARRSQTRFGSFSPHFSRGREFTAERRRRRENKSKLRISMGGGGLGNNLRVQFSPRLRVSAVNSGYGHSDSPILAAGTASPGDTISVRILLCPPTAPAINTLRS